MKSPMFQSLRVRLASLILLTMILLTGLVLLTYLHERSLILSHMRDDFMRLVTLVASDQEQLIARTRQFLITLAETPEVRAAHARGCPELLGRLVDEYPRYSTLGVLDEKGTLICGAGHPIPSAGLAGEPWFIHSLQSRDFAMGSLDGSGKEGSGFVISYPMSDAGGDVGALVFASIDLGYFGTLISHLQPPRQVVFMMVGQRGNVLSCYPSREDCSGSVGEAGLLVGAMVEKGTGTVQTLDSQGVDRLYAFAPLSSTVDTGIFIGVGVPISTFFTTVNRMLAFQFAGVWLVSILALSLVWFGSTAWFVNPVHAMVRTAHRLSRGDLDARTGISERKGELGSLAAALDEMAEALQEHAVQACRYDAQLRSLASQLTSAEERERRRIAEGIHDRVGQLLGISKIKLGMLRQGGLGAEEARLVEEVRDFIIEAIQETRSLTFELSPPILYEIGLEAALESLAERVQTQQGLRVVYSDDGQSKSLDDDIRALLYRAASELLRNVVKHARADRVTVTTRRSEDTLLLSVEDDGVGFLPEGDGITSGARDGFGLFSLRERLHHVGGHIVIEPRPGKGSRIVVTAPLKDRNTAPGP